MHFRKKYGLNNPLLNYMYLVSTNSWRTRFNHHPYQPHIPCVISVVFRLHLLLESPSTIPCSTNQDDADAIRPINTSSKFSIQPRPRHFSLSTDWSTMHIHVTRRANNSSSPQLRLIFRPARRHRSTLMHDDPLNFP